MTFFIIPVTMIFLLIVASIVFLFSISLLTTRKLIPTFPQLLAENIYLHSINLIGLTISRRGMVYFPYFVALYYLIIMLNLLGGLPYSTIITAQLIFTVGLGFGSFIGICILFIYMHSTYAFSAFFPKGSPEWIAPLLVTIEFISFMFRPISISLRLFANIMAGHTLVVILTGFLYQALFSFTMKSIIMSISLFIILFFIVMIETGVQLIQGYVFLLLLSNYLNSVLFLDH